MSTVDLLGKLLDLTLTVFTDQTKRLENLADKERNQGDFSETRSMLSRRLHYINSDSDFTSRFLTAQNCLRDVELKGSLNHIEEMKNARSRVKELLNEFQQIIDASQTQRVEAAFASFKEIQRTQD